MHQRLRRLFIAAFAIAALAAPFDAAIAATAGSRVAAADLARVAAATAVGQGLAVTEVELPATSETLALDVERFEVFAPDAEIVVHGASGTRTLPAPANAYFRGTVAGEEGSRVFLEVLANGETRGVITRAGDAAFLLDSAEPDGTDARGRLQALRADASQLKAGSEPWQCAQGDLPAQPQTIAGWDVIAAATPEGGAAAETDAETPQALPLYTARVAIETDFEFYAKFNNATTATNYVGNLIGYASTIYATEISTSLVVQSVSLWATASDPWTQTSTLCGLMEFGRYWNKNKTGTSRTIAHFMSGKSLGGGIAWLGVLCSNGFNTSASCPGIPTDAAWGGGYGFTASLSGTFDINNPTVMWDIMSVSHEIGHNFNSPHTHCYAGIGGSSSPIDQCYGTESGCYAGARILPGPAGAGSGTIMSYCHLVRSSYTDVSLNFGTGHPYGVQPGREAARMKSFVTSVAGGNPSCLAPAPASTAIFANGFESGVAAWTGGKKP
ncbi:MAG TPA: M12 family metallo-peptidase [Thermoanaerobaculia bacterium]|nr:M12 family metallo-peptidase [Thermoanaerobaculia bacterium]